MNNPRKLFYKVVVILPIVIFTLYTFTFAHQGHPNAQEQSISSVSDQEIAIRLKLSDDRFITISQYSGEMIKAGPQNGERLGITPRVLDDGRVTLEFFRIRKIIKGNVNLSESIISLGTMELNAAFAQSLSVSGIASVQLLGVSKSPGRSVMRVNYSQPGCPCCVTCDGWEMCGLSVQMSCGSCSCH